MKRWIVIGLLALTCLALWGSSNITTGNLEGEVEFYKGKVATLEAKLNAPQANMKVRNIRVEWGNGDEGKIVGEVKNHGDVDAINTYVRVIYYKGVFESYGDFVWIDYVRAGENKPFELKVEKRYWDEGYLPQLELGFKSVGEYGQEWGSHFISD